MNESFYDCQKRLGPLFPAKCQEIAAAMGADATLRAPGENSDCVNYIRTGDGVQIRLLLQVGYGSKGDRIEIGFEGLMDAHGKWVTSSDVLRIHESAVREITVAFDKHPAKIAADIQNRFLAHGRFIWDRMVELVAGTKNNAVQTATNAKMIAEALGVAYETPEKPVRIEHLHLGDEFNGAYRVTIDGNLVSFELNVDRDMAVEILKLLKK